MTVSYYLPLYRIHLLKPSSVRNPALSTESTANQHLLPTGETQTTTNLINHIVTKTPHTGHLASCTENDGLMKPFPTFLECRGRVVWLTWLAVAAFCL